MHHHSGDYYIMNLSQIQWHNMGSSTWMFCIIWSGLLIIYAAHMVTDHGKVPWCIVLKSLRVGAWWVHDFIKKKTYLGNRQCGVSIRVLFLHLITIEGNGMENDQRHYCDGWYSFFIIISSCTKTGITCIPPLYINRSWLVLSLGPGGIVAVGNGGLNKKWPENGQVGFICSQMDTTAHKYIL